MRLLRLSWLAALAGVAGLGRAASFDARLESLFRPLLAERMALSPDGQRVAYTARSGGDLAIVLMNLEQGGRKRTVVIDLSRAADFPADPAPLKLRFLRWATAGRLVFAPEERVVPLPPVVDESGVSRPNPDGPTIVSPILAMDADGQQRGILVEARDFMETPAEARRSLADLLRTPKQLAANRNEPVRWRMPHLDILGFFPGDREQLIIRTRGGFSMPAQHMVDVRTGSVREFGGDWPAPPDEQQVFDWFRLRVVGERRDAAAPRIQWRDEELAGVQRELDAKFPRRAVEILDWSETRTRVLARVTGGRDPGRIFVYQRTEDLVLEILRLAPWLGAETLNESRFFEFAAADGARLSGHLTWPREPRAGPLPLLVVLPTGFPGRAQPAFDPEAQVWADLGFMVARLNHRSAGGVRSEDLGALRAAVDRVAVDDARAAVEWLDGRFSGLTFDRRRIATLGRGFGGYLAVRAVQLHPQVFRCGVAIDAPMDLRPWLRAGRAEGAASAGRAITDIPAALIDHEGANWRSLSVVDQVEALTNPVLLLVEPGRNPAIDASTAGLTSRAQSLGRTLEHQAFDPGATEARADVFRRIDAFLGRHARDDAVAAGGSTEER